MIDSFAVLVLTFLNSHLSVDGTNFTKNHYNFYEKEINISQFVRECSMHNFSSKIGVLFPPIYHSAHIVKSGNNIIAKSGSFDFFGVPSFFGRLFITCDNFSSAKSATWIVSSYSKYFARLNFQPHISLSNLRTFRTENFSVSALALLLLLFLYYLKRRNYFLSAASMCFAFYTVGSIWGVLFPMVLLPMLFLHKISDIFLLIGVLLYFMRIRINLPIRTLLYVILTSICLIFISNTGDGVQFSTMISMPAMLYCLTLFLISFFSIYRTFCTFITCALIVFFIVSDLLSILGLGNFEIFLPLALCCLLLIEITESLLRRRSVYTSATLFKNT